MAPMSALIRRLNYAPLWTGYGQAWDFEIHHPSLDRWLYLLLHRLGLQGALSRRVIETQVKPGDLVVDIGGNIGLYAALLSRCVGPTGKVLTFEPVPVLQQSLAGTVARNRMTNVIVFPHALGARTETVSLRLDPVNSGNNWLSSEAAAFTQTTASVRRLDEISFERSPAFIKIDVQGWETQVLRGMDGLLAASAAPLLYCEVSEKALQTCQTSSRELGEILLDHGYRLQLPTLSAGDVKLHDLSLDALVEKASRSLYFDILAFPPQGRHIS